MPIATGHTTSALLNTAGISREEYGAQILLDYPNRSVMLAHNLVTMYDVANGYTAEAPVVGARAVTDRTRGTDDGQSGTSSALDDSSVSFTKKSVYDQLQWDYMQNSDLRPEMVRAWLDAEGEQSAMAHANDFDAAILGLYSSAAAANQIGGAGVHADITLIRQAISKARAANARGPYAFIFDETEWEHLDAIDELNRYDVTGIPWVNKSASPDAMPDFIYKNIPIFCTGNVPAASSINHNMLITGGAVVVKMNEWIKVDDWEEKKDFSFYVRTWSDYRYALNQSDYIVDIQTAA